MRPSVPTIVTASPPNRSSSIGFASWTQSPEIFVLPDPSTVVWAEKLSSVANARPLESRACSTRTSESTALFASS